MRPRNLDEFLGQAHLSGQKRFRRLVENDRLGSVILWGSARRRQDDPCEIVARSTGAHFIRVSAVSAGVRRPPQSRRRTREARKPTGVSLPPAPRRTILFYRRDPPLQQSAAGLRTSSRPRADCYPDRRDHGEPLVSKSTRRFSPAPGFTPSNSLTDEEIGVRDRRGPDRRRTRTPRSRTHGRGPPSPDHPRQR